MKRISKITALLLAVVTLISAGAVGAFAVSNERIIYDYLKSEMSLNTAAACAVLANIEKESSFYPSALGDNGTSYGICQWHDTRWDALNAFCAENGLDPATLDGQLAYLKYELETDYPDVLEHIRNVENSSDGAYDAAYYWCFNYEKPADKQNKSASRGQLARRYWKKYTPQVCGYCGEVHSGSFSQKILGMIHSFLYFFKNLFR